MTTNSCTDSSVPTVTAPGTGTIVSPSATSPAIEIPSTNRVARYRLNTEEQIRRREYIREFGDFPGSDNPALWRDLPAELPREESIEADLLQIDRDRRNDDFFQPNQPDSWFDRMRDLVEDLRKWNEERDRENDRKNDDNNSDSYGPGDHPDFLDDLRANS